MTSLSHVEQVEKSQRGHVLSEKQMLYFTIKEPGKCQIRFCNVLIFQKVQSSIEWEKKKKSFSFEKSMKSLLQMRYGLHVFSNVHSHCSNK